MTNALLVIDVQNDFITGSLPVPNGDAVAERIAQLIGRNQYDFVVSTQDWHFAPGDHFSDTPDFKDTWPVHCAAHTPGAELHDALKGVKFDASFFKGQYAASYSGFDGTSDHGVILGKWLAHNGVTSVDVVGLALDYCVKATALDAVKAGLTTRVLLPWTAAVNEVTGAEALGELAEAGVTVE